MNWYTLIFDATLVCVATVAVEYVIRGYIRKHRRHA
jgi:hypothetical protein